MWQRKLFLLGSCFLSLTIQCRAQQTLAASHTLTPTVQIKDAVTFVTVQYIKNGQVWTAKGTGFFIGVEDKRLGENKGFVYLVTNRHVAQPGAEEGLEYPVTRLSLRLNFKDLARWLASDEECVVPLGGSLHWYFPSDRAVDLAILPIAPDQDIFDYKVIPSGLLATRDVMQSMQIAEGDKVLFAGFFYSFPGKLRTEPIVREGILAMVPGEEMETTLHKAGHLYLADVHAFGGNSGAPMFVDVGGFRNGSIITGGFPFLLLGVVSGYYTEDEEFKLTVTTTLSGKVPENSGISTVVPADDLKALLESRELQAERDAQAASAPQR